MQSLKSPKTFKSFSLLNIFSKRAPKVRLTSVSPARQTVSLSNGFTIVELLVVIVVIGILATITIVAYRGVTQKATEVAITADLKNVLTKFKLFQVENSSYPTNEGDPNNKTHISDCATAIPATGNLCLKLSNGNTYGAYYVDNTVTPNTFCLTVKSTNNTKKYITQDGVPTNGVCSFAFASTLVANSPTRSQISLSWGAVTGATSYTIQRDTSSSFASPPVTEYTGSGTSTTSAGLLSSTTYYYRINAVVDGDTSSWSTPAASATTTAFAGPTGLAVTSKTIDSISLSWGAVTGATGYMLQRSSTSDFASHVDISTGSSTTVAASTGLAAGTYYYRVNVTDAGGTSSWSGTLTTATQYTQTYATPGSYTWSVPVNVTFVQLSAWGAQGSSGGSIGSTPGAGGLGGYSIGNLAVTTGNSLYVNVGSTTGGGLGGTGSSSSECLYAMAYGAGGNGGGASDVRYGGNTITPTDYRKIVAGGGGGGSGDSYDTDYSASSAGVAGGTGGGATGATGGGGNAGAGGTQSSGYSIGYGGPGANYCGDGGGGNGYYGGYGGGGNAGGSGGSGYIGGVTGGSTSGSAQSGNGKVTIAY
jgi:prepilin-type N-terminal cleavage/methylation domain-containing protein